MSLFGSWLEENRALQTESFGIDPADLKGQELRNYLVLNHSAVSVEMAEMLEEVRWKPWTNWVDGDDVVPNPRAFLKEAVDVLHFIANMLNATGMTTEDLERSYVSKMEVNRERQRRKGGYDSQRGIDKCSKCGRSYDDVAKSDTTLNDQAVCETCASESFGGLA